MANVTSTEEIMARIDEIRQERDQTLKDQRDGVLKALRAAGTTRVTIQYDGYGDAGNVEDITLEPEGVELTSEEAEALDAFGWDQAYSLHPGFENNEGGYGELIWDIAKDRIDLTHHDRFVDFDTTNHEGI